MRIQMHYIESFDAPVKRCVEIEPDQKVEVKMLWPREGPDPELVCATAVDRHGEVMMGQGLSAFEALLDLGDVLSWP